MTPAIIRKLVRAGRNNDVTWRYMFNLAPTLSFKLRQNALGSEATRVLEDLNRNGIAITSAEALLESQQSCYAELSGAVQRLENDLAAEIDATRANANDLSTIGTKTFIVQLLGENPTLNPQDVYARFALQPSILQIANGYFGMLTRLRYYNVWHTCVTSATARESQLWHRDREDFLILKMFVYLSDVDEGAGPFTYAPGTHPKGRIRQEASSHSEGGVKRSTDEQMTEIVNAEKWIKATGRAGTIVFADTHGYHKGGLAREHDRLMYVCMFTSQASQSQELMNRARQFNLPANKEQSFALALSKNRLQAKAGKKTS